MTRERVLKKFALVMKKPSALLVGLGGIGTITALSLETNDKIDVSVIIRNQDEEFLKNGITVDSISFGHLNYKPKSVFKSVEECKDKHFDYVIVCTKNLPDSSPCERMIEPVVKANTTIILIQNGLGIEKPMLEAYPNNLVISGIALTGSSKYGNYCKHVGIDEMMFGIFKSNTTPRSVSEPILHTFVDAYKRDDNKITIDENVELSRWYKLCYNSVFNTVCAIVDLDASRCQIAGGNDLLRTLIKEIVKIAASEGYILDSEKVEYIFHKSDGLFYHPSMQIDKEKNQLMEVEIIVGNPLRIAQKNGVDAPNLSLIYQLLRLIQFDIMEKQGRFKIKEDDFKNVASEDAPKVFQDLYMSK